jgi:alkanesulfonate monooxygenase SsuD/methylene tetrahydromethanopterin reductase-like flavin-dependent oxidoreductase (luciferase family)
VFIVTSRESLNGTASIIKDIRTQAVRRGRHPEDVRFFQGLSPVVGGTEAEAKAKEAAYIEQSNLEGSLAHMSGSLGVDLGAIDLDQPLATFDFQSMRGMVKGLIESAPDKSVTFRDLMRWRLSRQFLTGTPEQIADELQTWFEAGVDGFNFVYSVTPGTFVDFIEAVVPILQARGLVQRAYAPGPLRQKIFGHAKLPKRHPAAAYRRR